MSEDDNVIVVLWLVHGTSLLRCAPNHVRPIVEEANVQILINPQAALEALDQLRARSTTQYRDLAKAQDTMDPIFEDLAEPDREPEDSTT